MKVKFEAVLDGLAKFIDKEIYPNMNDWQEILVRITIGRVFENRESVKTSFVNNGFIRTFGIIDEEVNVDIERLTNDLKTEISRKGKMTVTIPLYGNLTIHPSDIDKLYKTIMEDIPNENN